MLFFILLKESFLFAVNSLVVNKLRTFLSLLGITIGIFAVISVFTIVDALEKNLRSSVASLGDNVIFIQKWPWEFSGSYPWWKYINRPQPSLSELEAVKYRSKYAEACALSVRFQKTIKHENNSIEGISIIAATYEYDKVKNFEIENGRYFTEQECAHGKNVAIIGDAIATTMFPNEEVIGNTLTVLGRKVKIIGTFKKEGESILGGNIDTQVLIPIDFARNLMDIRAENIDPTLFVRGKEGIKNEELIGELQGIMRSIRKLEPLADDNFALNQTSILSKKFDELFDFIGTAGWVIGGFSILVGGFGIANIMFVSVKERTSLIGIQKSLGAKNYFILFQFLTESVMLSLIGGLIGLIIIFIGTLLIGDSFGMEVSLSSSNILLGLTISVLIGVISGFIPAYSASQLDPVEAIRAN